MCRSCLAGGIFTERALRALVGPVGPWLETGFNSLRFPAPPALPVVPGGNRTDASRAGLPEPGKPEPGLMIARSGLAVRIQSPIVELLPVVGGCRRPVGLDPFMEGQPRLLPVVERLQQFGMVLHRPQLGLQPAEDPAGGGKKEAERLILLKPDPDVGPGETPVHREGVGRPVGLDHAAQGGDAVLYGVGRTADPKVPAL